ncbi:MAG: hypothetical protein AB7K71_10720 [Polyangiaceae bacterium]
MTENHNNHSNVIELRPVQSAKFNGLAVAVGGFADGIPRVRDLDLAKWLGFSVPYDIRKLVRRYAGRGFFNHSKLFAIVAKSSHGRRGTEYWLTEEQALFIAAKTEQPRGVELLEELILCFMEARRRHGRPLNYDRLLFQLEERRAWESFWDDGTIVSICKLYRWPTHGSTGSIYQPLSGVMNRLYRLLLGDVLVDEIKRRNPNPAKGHNHHQLLQDKLRERCGEDLRLVKIFADQSATPAEWWNRLEYHFRRDPLQLGLVGCHQLDACTPRAETTPSH